MNRFAALIVLVLSSFASQAHSSPADVEVCFTPPVGCTSRIVQAIDSARAEIRVQAYLFTSRPIIAALAQARRRGVDVAVILDKTNESLWHWRALLGCRVPGARRNPRVDR